jgi:hypothetical protein
MAYSTFSQLIQRTIERLSEVPGESVQVYSENRIASMVQHKFTVLFEEEYWPQFSSWQTGTLDGVAGVVTADLSSLLKRHDDLRVVFVAGRPNPIPALSTVMNPHVLTGTTPQFVELIDEPKFFRVWPLAATGSVNFHIRTRPEPFVLTDVVNFDEEALVLGATFDYLDDDGTNPGAVAKFQGLFEQRVQALRKNIDQHGRPLNPMIGRVTIPTEWTVPVI